MLPSFLKTSPSFTRVPIAPLSILLSVLDLVELLITSDSFLAFITSDVFLTPFVKVKGFSFKEPFLKGPTLLG